MVKAACAHAPRRTAWGIGLVVAFVLNLLLNRDSHTFFAGETCMKKALAADSWKMGPWLHYRLGLRYIAKRPDDETSGSHRGYRVLFSVLTGTLATWLLWLVELEHADLQYYALVFAIVALAVQLASGGAPLAFFDACTGRSYWDFGVSSERGADEPPKKCCLGCSGDGANYEGWARIRTACTKEFETLILFARHTVGWMYDTMKFYLVTHYFSVFMRLAYLVLVEADQEGCIPAGERKLGRVRIKRRKRKDDEYRSKHYVDSEWQECWCRLALLSWPELHTRVSRSSAAPHRLTTLARCTGVVLNVAVKPAGMAALPLPPNPTENPRSPTASCTSTCTGTMSTQTRRILASIASLRTSDT